jgi:hypothetical protein
LRLSYPGCGHAGYHEQDTTIGAGFVEVTDCLSDQVAAVRVEHGDRAILRTTYLV